MTDHNRYYWHVCDRPTKSIRGSPRATLEQTSKTSWGPLMLCTPLYLLGTALPHRPVTWIMVSLNGRVLDTIPEQRSCAKTISLDLLMDRRPLVH